MNISLQLILIPVLVVLSEGVSDVCRNLANGVKGDYSLEDVNACHECEWHKVDMTNRKSSSPSMSPATGPEMSRMTNPDGAWCSGGDGGNYLEIDVSHPMKLGGIEIQGYAAEDAWVTSFQASYKDAEGAFQFFKDYDGNVQDFEANTDPFGVQERRFRIPVQASAIRIYPASSHNAACMRADLFSCSFEDVNLNMAPTYDGPVGNSAPALGMKNSKCWREYFCKVDVPTDCGANKCIKYKTDVLGCETCNCVEDVEGKLFEADILLTNETAEMLKESYGMHKDNPGIMKAASRRSNKWTDQKRGNNYLVPYTIDTRLSAAANRGIQSAIDHLKRYTCIELVRRTNQRQHIRFVGGGGCSSPVGKQYNGNQVTIGLGCEHMGTVVHEILHSLGFWHEQSRPDRDNHVIINWGNIQQGLSYNFQKRTTADINSLGSPYDTSSVMHYGSYAFSANRRPTIVSRSGNVIQTQRAGLSKEDIKQINAMYGCDGTGTGTGTGSTATPTTTTKTPVGSCEDQNRYCSYWARMRECRKNPGYMLKNCKKSCGQCGSDCKDLRKECRGWALRYCNHITYAAFMKKNCPASCGHC